MLSPWDSVPWDIVLHGFLSLWGVVPLGFCHPCFLSHLDVVPLGFCPPGILSSWVFVFLGFCPLGYCPMGFCPLGFCPRTLPNTQTALVGGGGGGTSRTVLSLLCISRLPKNNGVMFSHDAPQSALVVCDVFYPDLTLLRRAPTSSPSSHLTQTWFSHGLSSAVLYTLYSSDGLRKKLE